MRFQFALDIGYSFGYGFDYFYSQAIAGGAESLIPGTLLQISSKSKHRVYF